MFDLHRLELYPQHSPSRNQLAHEMTEMTLLAAQTKHLDALRNLFEPLCFPGKVLFYLLVCTPTDDQEGCSFKQHNFGRVAYTGKGVQMCP